MHKMQVDTFASALKAGERPGCNGLVLVVGWSWGSQDNGYQQLASEMRSLDDSHTLVYDGEYTHCTCATLSSFKNPRSVFFHASPADRERIILAWHRSLEAALAKAQGLHPFEIVFRSLETSPAATFLRADDGSTGMEYLRSAVKEAACTPQLGELSAELEDKYSGAHPELCSLKDALHVPGIVHSTIMRVAVQPSGPAAEKRLAEGLADLGARWKPATVKVGAMSLVHEKHPYMHLTREGGETHCYSLPSR